MAVMLAKVAVAAATYWIDKPFDYRIPEELLPLVKEGCRVYVPFSRGNRISEGIVLSVEEGEERDGLKAISDCLDPQPVIDHSLLQLAFFMRERYFCTVYDCIKAMLPTGLHLSSNGMPRRKGNTAEFAVLETSSEDAMLQSEERRRKSPKQSAILRELADFGELSSTDLLFLSGAKRSSLKALETEGILSLKQVEILARPLASSAEKADFPVLNEEQAAVFSRLSEQIQKKEYGVSLLHGITGSGKTQVYIHLIRYLLQDGKGAILLVPEIALTPQMVLTFTSLFGNQVAVLHSSLSMGERLDEWKRVKEGIARLVIGTRSAVFAPVQNLQLIIIDEEQESTYHSENNPRYDTKEVAQFRCYKANGHLLLGSATPDIGTRYQAEKGLFHYYRLDHRFNAHALPEVRIVDMKKELKNGNDSEISSVLRKEIETNLERGEQSILFLNRRGANKFVTCGECGFTYKCPNCSVSLTYHSVSNRLICHYCGFTTRPGHVCPECGGILSYIGAGTQLVEEELKVLFPGTDVLRMDADVINKSNSHEKLFQRFQEEKIPILLGTQMITKGLNFENVTLVGILSADQTLYVNDYKAAEKAFSQITQVIGRSGRGRKAGRAVIQTFTPENETIRLAAKQDYDSFYRCEIEARKLQQVPPFADLMTVNCLGESERKVIEACRTVKIELQSRLGSRKDLQIMGPTPYSVVKVNNRFRYRIILRCNVDKAVRTAVSEVLTVCNSNNSLKGISFFAENNPEE